MHGMYWWNVNLGLLIATFMIFTGNCSGQCDEPIIFMPHNSTGNLAFPNGNLDSSGTWNNNYHYPSSSFCTWILRAPPGHVINMRFLHFRTEEKFDYVTMYGSEDQLTELFHYSGDLKEEWESATPDNILVITFTSDEFTSYQGFQLAYRYLPKACVSGGFHIDESQLIAVPPWNLQGALPGPVRPEYYATEVPGQTEPYWVEISAYPHGMNCTWTIGAVGKHVTQIDVLRFQSSPSDVLQIFQVENTKLKPYLKFWDDKISQSRILSTQPLVMNFASSINTQSTGSGFLLNITYVSQACKTEPENLTTPKGVIAYPEANLQRGTWGSESSIYYGEDSCTWIIQAPEGYVVNITILQFDTDVLDQLVITDGNGELFAYGGTDPISYNIISDTNEVYLNFTSITDSKNTGFLLQYSWILKSCKFTLDPVEGVVKSPYYPDIYGSQVRCQWTLNPTSTNKIAHFVIIRLRIDKGDFLQISDGEKNTLLTTETKFEEILELHTKQSITVNFLSDSTYNDGYFYIKYIVFDPGNCDFDLTMCGWISGDAKQLWTLEEHKGMITMQEPVRVNDELPRGYKAPLFYPSLQSTEKGNTLVSGTTEMPQTVCLNFTYLLTGQDAYKLKVYLEQRTQNPKWQQDSKEIFVSAGPQGEKFITPLINITVHSEYRVKFVYEKGYGPHYKVAISSVFLQNEACPSDEMSNSINCELKDSFCGWKNTYTDHQNWLLGDKGISTHSIVRTGSHKHPEYASLESPFVNRSTLFTNESKEVCFGLKYQIHSRLAELKLLAIAKQSGLRILDGMRSMEHEIWSIGGLESSPILTANIPFFRMDLPEEFQFVLRSFSKPVLGPATESLIEGVTVFDISLNKNQCSDISSCNFQHGFCSWQVISPGQTVWQISKGQNESSYASVFSPNNAGETTYLISSKVNLTIPKHISYRYRLSGDTKQCLQIFTNDQIIVERKAPPPLWRQCKNKGKQWLLECIDLPVLTSPQYIFFTNLKGDAQSILWVDDIDIQDGPCATNIKESSNPTTWECQPKDTLCRLTEPLSGSWAWSYEQLEANIKQEHFICTSGDYILPGNKCNGIVDCMDASDELYCDNDHKPKNNMLSVNISESKATCKNGQVINISWFCDGIADCHDASDEINCDQNVEEEFCSGKEFECPSGIACDTFNCPPGVKKCLDPEFVCDNVIHCNKGEDEISCGTRQDHTSANKGWLSNSPGKGDSGMTLSGFKPDDISDNDVIECSNGLQLPKSFRCDGRKDCPLDGKDEIGCHHCSGSDFLCPISGVCLPWSSVCDGELSIDTCTDEDFCESCPPGYFACDVCLTSYQICDGTWDCMNGEDELRCMSLYSSDQMMGDAPRPTTFVCLPNQFQCLDGRCIHKSATCDRKPDCSHGEDELRCRHENEEVTSYLKAEYLGPKSIPSALITPAFHISEEEVGILSFDYSFDVWIGSSNVSISIEIVEANDTSKSLFPWSIWRQSVQKDPSWMKASVLIPFSSIHSFFKVAFVIHGKAPYPGSEKIYFSNLSFKSVPVDELLKHADVLGTCDFDDSWCGWTQPFSQNGYGWSRGGTSAHTHRRTGPISGYNNGKTSGFIYADSIDGKFGNIADLVSPMISLPPSGICFSFMVFLFGHDIGGITVLSGQKSGDHVFSKELIYIEGSQGMSWIPISISINETHLSNIEEPFLLIIRSHRGSGIAGDVAIDHIKIMAGTCNDPQENFTMFLQPFMLDVPKDLLMMKGGSPISRYEKPVVSDLDDVKKNHIQLDEFCSNINSCMECVSSSVIKCSWCDEGHFCLSQNSPRSEICSKELIISHNTTENDKAGPEWCPQMITSPYSTVSSSIHSPIHHNFGVLNIQPSHVNLQWKCRYSLNNSLEADSSSFDEEMTFLRGLESDTSNEELWALLKGFSVNEQHHYDGNVIEVPGKFKGTVIPINPSMTEKKGPIMGLVVCGDGESTLDFGKKPIPNVDVNLVAPSGKVIDNPLHIQVETYNCPDLATTCEKCIALASNNTCGWCASSETCIDESLCLKGKWTSSSSHSKETCHVQEELNLLSKLMQLESDESDFDNIDDSLDVYAPITKKKVGKHMKKTLGSLREDEYSRDKKSSRKNKVKRREESKGKSRSDKKKERKEGKKLKKRSFLRIPIANNIFVARSTWRLHTGRQYYVPITKKTLINLGFVREVIFGNLEDEKSRTILVDGKWKKATGFYVDLFEKDGTEPVTSIITTKKSAFEQILKQMDQKL